MTVSVQELLDKIELERSVKILFAVESGSRAWGLDSPKSDHDIRFVFVHPHERYLRMTDPADTIQRAELSTNTEIDSWELRKLLRLLMKGNPTCMEWVFADVILKHADWDVWPGLGVLRKLAEYYTNPIATYHHYLHIAKNNYRDYIAGKGEVPVKKLTHVFRGLLSAMYIVRNRTLPQFRPPHNFDILLESVFDEGDNHTTTQAIKTIAGMKRSGVDTMGEPTWLNEFLESTFADMKTKEDEIARPEHKEHDKLDLFFTSCLRS